MSRPILMTDIKGPALYGPIRDDFRKHIIETKKHRRVIVGDRVSLVFENRHTLMFQIEEMLRTENISDPKKIQDEIDVYSALLPSVDSLSATLFIELPAGADARVELDKLIGLDEHVLLVIGEEEVRAEFEPGRSTTERISAVQYIRFRLSANARQQLQTPQIALSLRIDHPKYEAVGAMTEDMRASLAADLS